MGQYRLSIMSMYQIGFLIKFQPGHQLTIDLPFITISIGLMECARGVKVFGWYK